MTGSLSQTRGRPEPGPELDAIIGKAVLLPDLLQFAQRAFVLLDNVTDDDECYRDHHGNCQTHLGERECSHAAARALLDRYCDLLDKCDEQMARALVSVLRGVRKDGERRRETVSLPCWIFDHVGERFLVAVRPDGSASVDGGHGDAQGVAKARELFQRLAAIRPPAGTKYVMLTVETVPPFVGLLNEEAIAINNGALSPADDGGAR